MVELTRLLWFHSVEVKEVALGRSSLQRLVQIPYLGVTLLFLNLRNYVFGYRPLIDDVRNWDSNQEASNLEDRLVFFHDCWVAWI